MSNEFTITIQEGDERLVIDMTKIWESHRTNDSPTITRIEGQDGMKYVVISRLDNSIVISERSLHTFVTALCMYALAVSRPAGVSKGFSVSPHNPIS